MTQAVVTTVPMAAVRPENICPYCSEPVAWEEAWQRGATWNPPSVNAVRHLSHRDCENAALDREAARGTDDMLDNLALFYWRGSW